MAKKIKRPITWFLGKAMNVKANWDGGPAGQIRVCYITFDRKIVVQFPNGGQEVHTVKRLEAFSKDHGGWVDAIVPTGNPAYPIVYNPFDCDLMGKPEEYVEHLRLCGVSDEDIAKGITARIEKALKG